MVEAMPVFGSVNRFCTAVKLLVSALSSVVLSAKDRVLSVPLDCTPKSLRLDAPVVEPGDVPTNWRNWVTIFSASRSPVNNPGVTVPVELVVVAVWLLMMLTRLVIRHERANRGGNGRSVGVDGDGGGALAQRRDGQARNAGRTRIDGVGLAV